MMVVRRQYRSPRRGSRRFHSRVPTLAIWGEDDRTVPLGHADLLVHEAAKARRAVIAGAGHAAYVNDARTVNAELMRFLNSDADWGQD